MLLLTRADGKGARGAAQPSASTPMHGAHVEKQLEGWKAIAQYFGRTVRTVQRWEREQGLPVRRHLHNVLASAYAVTRELDEWRAQRVAIPGTDRAGVRGGAPEVAAPLRIPREAYEAYVRGRYYWEKRTLQSFERATREFRTALDAEPAWALPYVGLAETYVALSANEFWPPMDGYPKARAAATHALDLDPHLAAPRTVVGFVRAFFDADWNGAINELTEAASFDPLYPNAPYWHGLVLMNLGRFDEAVDQIRRAAELAPLSPAITANIGRPLLCAGRYEEALHHFRRGLAVDDGFWIAHICIGWAYQGMHQYQDAITAFQTAATLSGGAIPAVSALAHAYAEAGARDCASRMLDELLVLSRSQYVPPVRIARILVALGQFESALTRLEDAARDRSLRNNTYLPYDSAFAKLRGHPRFRQLLRDELNLRMTL